ncbi:hypothetical protein GJ496_002743 [Pomphorhynchus laevis]|nr:hypothetical protein GJ496_002743 [Pomphorhynchus laevis]
MELKKLSGIAPDDEPDVFETEGVVPQTIQYAEGNNDISVNVIDIEFEDVYKQFREQSHFGFFTGQDRASTKASSDDQLDVTSLLEHYKSAVNECRRLENLLTSSKISPSKDLENVYCALSDILKINFQPKTKAVTTESHVANNSLPSEDRQETAFLHKFKILEERISFLEKIVGLQDNILEEISAGVTDKSIMGILADYKSKIDTFNPSIINDAGNRLSRFVQSMSDSSTEQVCKAIEDAKLQKLSEIIDNNLTVIDLIPYLLTRLESLNILHTKAVNFNEQVTTLEEKQRIIADTIAANSELLNNLNNNLSRNLEYLQKTIKSNDK